MEIKYYQWFGSKFILVVEDKPFIVAPTGEMQTIPVADWFFELLDRKVCDSDLYSAIENAKYVNPDLDKDWLQRLYERVEELVKTSQM